MGLRGLGMTTHGAMVLVDADTAICVCPYHGAQAGADYRTGVAPCGCRWQLDKHGVLRALRTETETMQHAIPLRLPDNKDGKSET